MNLAKPFEDLSPAHRSAAPGSITLAVHAMGGQGGGVLVDWIIKLAEAAGHAVQATSVAGVAQRTGATLYYVEMMAPPREGWLGRKPVLALMPGPGEVDVVIGAELMEAGRAIQRGLVTPDRTTLIASAHRAYAVSETMVPGDGMADPSKVYEAAARAARRFIAFDMAELAERAGSVISAVLFGALAGSGALPFGRAAFEAAIRGSGIGVGPSLEAFALGYAEAAEQSTVGKAFPAPRLESASKRMPRLEPAGWAPFDALVARARGAFPEVVHAMLAAGLGRTVDFQDAAYGAEYLDRLGDVLKLDAAGHGYRLTMAAAKHIARAMAYDDVIRVADLKTRAARFNRIRLDVAAAPNEVLATTEFMHPRVEELAGSMPLRLGLLVENNASLQRVMRFFVDRPRRLRTLTISGFLPLYLIGGLRRFRRGSLRHSREQAHLAAWLARVAQAAPDDYGLAVELVENRRLIKGYGDTHARGSSKFERVMAAADRLAGRPDAADWVRRLRVAALADGEGTALDQALKTVGSFLDG